MYDAQTDNYGTESAAEELANLEAVAAKFKEAVAFAQKSGVDANNVQDMDGYVSDMLGDTINSRIGELRDELEQQASYTAAMQDRTDRAAYQRSVL